MVSFFLLELVAELLDSAGEGGGKDSKVDMEGASLCIFKLITPWSVSNLSIAHETSGVLPVLLFKKYTS